MAVLQLKNKYEVSLTKLLKQSAEDGGVPDFFEVSGREAWEILNEMRAVPQTKFVIESTDEYDPQFILKSTTEKLDHDTAQDLVTHWFNKEFGVTLKKDANTIVPLRVTVKPKPQPNPQPPPEEKKEEDEEDPA